MAFVRVLAASAALALTTLATAAFADDNFELDATSKGQIVVRAHDGWHINPDYSWSIKKGGDKVKSKEDFTLEKGKATITGLPAGTYTVKGAVCSESACAPFVKENVTVQ